MSVIPKLASSLGRRDDVPNKKLAEHIARTNDRKAVQELVANLSCKARSIQSDSIKVLYEIGGQKPELIAGYAKDFIALLDNRNNRLAWGAMTALDAITIVNPKAIVVSLATIVAGADKGSVITRDHAVGILTKLAGIKQYARKAFPLLVKQLEKCPANQLPMYAENALPIVKEKNKALFLKTLSSRLDDIEKESKRKRVEQVLKKLSAQLHKTPA